MVDGLEIKSAPQPEEAEKKESLWSSLLNDVQSHSNRKLPSCKSVLVLGNNESGKTTLVAKLQGVEDPKKGAGLEYAYIDVRDEYRDDNTRLSVWVLDGDEGHTNLLKFALNEETFEHTLVMLVVSMTAPWSILEQLQAWSTILGDHVDGLKLDLDLRQRCRERATKLWLEYSEPAADEAEPNATSPMKRSSTEVEESSVPEGVLTTNLGLDLVVVVTKTDYMVSLEKEMDYRDEHLDFMQQWIRKFCLQHGAALFYTSAKEDKNCDLLYRYMVHRVYGLPFRTPALVVEKDAVFIPAGWDNFNKIAILYEGLHSCRADDYYRDVIVAPTARKAPARSDGEVLAEDEQSFLSRQMQSLMSGTAKEAQAASMGKASSPRFNQTPQGSSPAAKKLDSNKIVSSAAGEGVLANFFNSLLNKKMGTPGKEQPPATPEKMASSRSDAAAELDRLSRSKTSPDSSEC